MCARINPLLAWLLMSLTIETCSAIALTFELPDNEKMCFFEDFQGARSYVFEYNVLKGGKNDVDASVKSPNGRILYTRTKKKSDSFKFDTSPGSFSFCFSNEFSTFTHKTVYFTLYPEESDTLAKESGNTEPTVNTQMEELLEHIHKASTRVVTYQIVYRLLEFKARHRAEVINQRIHWWSIGETVVIIFAGFGQVIILKAFFTERKSLASTL